MVMDHTRQWKREDLCMSLPAASEDDAVSVEELLDPSSGAFPASAGLLP